MIKYYPRNTVIHRAPPALKIAAMFIALLLSIAFVNLYLHLAIFILTLTAIFVARLPLKAILKFAWIFIALATLMFFLQAFIYPSHDIPVFELLSLKVYAGSIRFGAISALRLLIVGFMAPVVLMTTKVSELGVSASNYLPRYLAFGLMLSFRFIPIFIEEINKIKMSQETRATRGLRLTSLLVPLFAKALRRAKTMSYSVESRGFSTQ